MVVIELGIPRAESSGMKPQWQTNLKFNYQFLVKNSKFKFRILSLNTIFKCGMAEFELWILGAESS